MSYNNLLYLLVVIFLLSVRQTFPVPTISLTLTLVIFVLKVAAFYYFCAWLYRPRSRPFLAKDHLQVEKYIAWVAIIALAGDIFGLDLLSYFVRLPLLIFCQFSLSFWG